MGRGGPYCLTPILTGPDSETWQCLLKYPQATWRSKKVTQQCNSRDKLCWQRWMKWSFMNSGWMLNNSVQMFARGSAGLAPELLTGQIWSWNLFLICGHWHQSAQVMGAAVDQAPGVPPNLLHGSPTLLPAFLSQTNSLTAWWGWRKPLHSHPSG